MKRNYNRLALQGLQIDDMEFVQEFGLNPDVAYTPRINKVMSELMEQKNIRELINIGKSESEAKSIARRNKQTVDNDIKKLLA